MTGFKGDIRYCIRRLLGRPLFASTVMLSLALGIGLNTAIFSFIRGLFFSPLPSVANLDRLAAVYSATDTGPGILPVSYLNFRDFRERNTTFEELAAHQLIRVGLSDAPSLGAREAEQVSGQMVSANFFQTLRLQPALGRTFLADEAGVSTSHPLVILGYGLWQRRFGADPAILGTTVYLNGHPFTVIGVAPPGFYGTQILVRAEIWVPLSAYRDVFEYPGIFRLRSSQMLNVVGRLRDGVALGQADNELKAIAAHLAEEYPEANKGQSVGLLSLRKAVLPPNRRAVFLRAATLLFAATLLLLLLACTNIANLMLAKGLERSQEMAVRLSLGAERKQLIRSVLLESFLLALLGGALSLLIARWAWQILWSIRPPFLAQAALEMTLDTRLLLFTLLLSTLTATLFGSAPAIQTARADVASVLKEDTSLGHQGRGRATVRGLLVGTQLCLCAFSLAVAGFFLKSLYNAQQIDPGFETEKLAIVSFDLRSLGYDEIQGRAFCQRLMERARALPGVEMAAFGEDRLLGGFRLWREVRPAGQEVTSASGKMLIGSTTVGREYFATTAISLLRGRAFDQRDRVASAPVVIVNELVAEQLWPGRDPIGQYIFMDDEPTPLEVVGVAENSKYLSLGEDPRPLLYLPLAQRYTPRLTLHVRSRSNDPHDLLLALRESVRSLDPALPLLDVRTISEVIQRSLWAPKLTALLLGLFSVIAVCLAGVGVYGIATEMVTRRRHEIGVRMALGARRSDVLTTILRSGLSTALFGLAAGLLAALLIRGWLSSLLFGAGLEDLATLPVIASLLLGVSTIANFLPALRATRRDPVHILRSQ